jgi:hypothetical protein
MSNNLQESVISGVTQMESMLQRDNEEDRNASKLSRQAVSFFLHTVLALGTWLVLMFAGYALNFRQDEMAPLVWLVGLIWVLIVALWILDMPTGPNACFQCGATEKLSRTFFSLPKPSGLIDNDGPFLGTWPAAALLGYSIGARLALRRRPESD